ncbi:hypothetical protein FLONG3_2871 [Fusarium longipes]|uniref:Uncharacterized protein n=1 Tax=Fusarium longipes TaxID=694270 RepID=A0A395T409_9HYPO|nr:hypothetical protein FLONG3_2871 [Fusarium longipes]
MTSNNPLNQHVIATASANTTRNSSAFKDLEIAIATFQATLTDDDRKQLQELKNTSHDAQSIIKFTADLEKVDKGRRGKNIASRLASFLQTIQQFTPIIDTYIQSNPEITALIWGSIKLTFMFLANFTSYFQSFVELLHGFGSLCTRFAEYQAIFNDSARLKDPICQFHTAIIRCCETIVVIIRRPWQKRHGLLQDLSTFNFTSTFNIQRSKRHLRTAEWIFQTREFEEWSNDEGPPVIHITGKIGSGKTVLASSVVERLCCVRLPARFTSFVFIRFDDEQSLKAETVVRSCVQQLLTVLSYDQLTHKAATQINSALQEAKSTMYSDESVMKLYSMASMFVKNWYIVLDGLDECDTRQQADILKFFAKLLNSTETPPRLMLCSRETSSATIGNSFPFCVRLITGLHQTSSDIRTYAEDIINAKLEAQELVVRDLKIVNEILETIVSKEQGMFLWAFLAIEDICSRKSDTDIRRALEEMPADLPATFDRVLDRIMKKGHKKIAKKTFAWIEAVLYPLTLPQLQEALSIEIGQRTLQQDDLINGITRLSRWCEGFIEVAETDDTVHFSHHSIREFLLMPGVGELQELHIEVEKCHQLVGETCITYITLDNLQTGLAKRAPTYNLDMREIAAQTVHTAVRGDIGSRLARLVRRVPKSEQSNKDFTTEGLTPCLAKPQPVVSPEIMQYPFLTYAKESWFKHTVYLDSVANNATWVLLGKILSGNIPYPQNVPWEDPTWKQHASETYSYLMRSGASILDNFDKNIVSIFTYGYQHGNWGLCCRAFMLLAEACKREKNLQFQLSTLAAAKNHKNCKNGCFSVAEPELDHLYFVDRVTEAIERGTLYMPASRKPYTKEDCNRRTPHYPELHEDICTVMSNGYRRGEDPSLEFFAALAVGFRHTRTSINSICSKYHVNIGDLSTVTTKCSKSIFDIMAESLLSRGDRLLNPDLKTWRELYCWDIRSAHIAGMLWQLLTARDKKDFSSEKQKDGRMVEEFILFSNDTGVIPLHPTTIERIFDLVIIPCERPRGVLDHLLPAFFGNPIKPTLRYTHEAIIRNLLQWTFPATVVFHTFVSKRIRLAS